MAAMIWITKIANLLNYVEPAAKFHFPRDDGPQDGAEWEHSKVIDNSLH